MSVSEFFDWLGLSKTTPAVKVTTLPKSYYKFPPSPAPTTVPPPPDHPTFAHPFTIPTNLYNALLSPNVPITVALVYMSVVAFLNSVNADRNHKPWAFSRTRLFKLVVVLHNVFLAAYSAWTFVGMLNALRLSFPAWGDHFTVAETVDTLCKLHGPRGIGNAAAYNSTTSAWAMTNRLFHLAADGLGPETTDVGRIWNEGLAFYGWLFYLSKFYEVIDTCIILAKGRKSSLLQTYHHAGAMLSMWAGIRYMSPPIWMFVFVNSGIHAVMVGHPSFAFRHQADLITVHVLSLVCPWSPCTEMAETVVDNSPDHPICDRSNLRLRTPVRGLQNPGQRSLYLSPWGCSLQSGFQCVKRCFFGRIICDGYCVCWNGSLAEKGRVAGCRS